MSNSETGILKSIKEFLETYPIENPNHSSEDSMGNYDDVFYDGLHQGEYDVVQAIRTIINNGEKN